MNMRQKVADS